MGRDRLIDLLATTPDQGSTTVLTQTMSGLGGVGKTTLAAALIDARRHELDVAWWVRAETEATLLQDLVELGRRVEGLALVDDVLCGVAGEGVAGGDGAALAGGVR